MLTEEGNDNAEANDDKNMETDIVKGADSPLVDEVGLCGSNKAEMLLRVLWGMFEENRSKKLWGVDENGEELLTEKKTPKKNEGNGWKNPAWRKTVHASESHDQCSEPLGMREPKDRWPQALKALLVVNSFKLHLNAYNNLVCL